MTSFLASASSPAIGSTDRSESPDGVGPHGWGVGQPVVTALDVEAGDRGE